MRALIDDVLPEYDVRERHRTRVHASPEATYAAVLTADLAAAPMARALLFARAVPGALASGRAGLRALRNRHRQPVTLRDFEARGFRIIAERAPHEIVIGLEGRFWLMGGGVCSPPATSFRSTAQAPGTARAIWNFTARETPSGATELATETRVRCADRAARRRFLPYWLVIRAGSGMIRRMMLREIRRTAERRTS